MERGPVFPYLPKVNVRGLNTDLGSPSSSNDSSVIDLQSGEDNSLSDDHKILGYQSRLLSGFSGCKSPFDSGRENIPESEALNPSETILLSPKKGRVGKVVSVAWSICLKSCQNCPKARQVEHQRP